MTQDEQERAEEEFLYSPEKGNVAFVSAMDNWAFTLDTFAPRLCKQLGMGNKPKMLKKFLWGQYYYMQKEKKLLTKAPGPKSMEMFSQYVMGPLISEYRKPEYFNQEMLTDKDAQRVAHKKIKEVFQKMLPLKTAILKMVTEHLPTPIMAQKVKIDTLSAEFKKKTPLYLPVR